MPLGPRPPGPPVAIVIRREGLAFTPVEYLRVEGQAVPPVFTLPEGGGASGLAGFWYELIDGHGAVLYRATGKDPLGASVEFPGEDGLSREPAPVRPIQFRLLVPLSVAMQGVLLRIFSLETSLFEDVDPTKPVAEITINITEGSLDDH